MNLEFVENATNETDLGELNLGGGDGSDTFDIKNDDPDYGKLGIIRNFVFGAIIPFLTCRF